jgi:hypothetical protein
MRLIMDVNTKYCTERTSLVHILAKKQEVSVRHRNLQCGKLQKVLRIRSRLDPKLLAGSGYGSGKKQLGSGQLRI